MKKIFLILLLFGCSGNRMQNKFVRNCVQEKSDFYKIRYIKQQNLSFLKFDKTYQRYVDSYVDFKRICEIYMDSRKSKHKEINDLMDSVFDGLKKDMKSKKEVVISKINDY
jgi:hypothetical protein